MTQPTNAPRPGVRGGFTLIEVIVSVVLLGAILTMLGGLSYHTARTAINVNNGTQRQAYALEMINRLIAMDYDSLTVNSGECDTISANNLSYGRCYTVSVTGDQADVTVTVTPMQAGSFPQTFSFSRVSDPAPNPLNTQ